MFAHDETPFERGFDDYGFTDECPFNDADIKREWWDGWFAALVCEARTMTENDV